METLQQLLQGLQILSKYPVESTNFEGDCSDHHLMVYLEIGVTVSQEDKETLVSLGWYPPESPKEEEDGWFFS